MIIKKVKLFLPNNNMFLISYLLFQMKFFSLLMVLCMVCSSLALPSPLAQQQGDAQGQQGDKRFYFGGLYNQGLYNPYGGYYGGNYGGYNPYGLGGGFTGGYGFGGYNPYNQLWR